MIQDKGDSNKWAYIKMDHVRTKNPKIRQNIKTNQNYRQEEYVENAHKTTNTVFFEEQENQEKKDLHNKKKDTNKNII